MESPASSPLSYPLTHYVNHHKVPPLPCPAGGIAWFNKGPIPWPVRSGYFLFLNTYLPTSFDSLAAAFGLDTKPAFVEWQLPNLHLLNDNSARLSDLHYIWHFSLWIISLRSLHTSTIIHPFCYSHGKPGPSKPEASILGWLQWYKLLPSIHSFHPSLLLLSELSVKSGNLCSAGTFLLIIR